MSASAIILWALALAVLVCWFLGISPAQIEQGVGLPA
jgi:hypothetical protein